MLPIKSIHIMTFDNNTPLKDSLKNTMKCGIFTNSAGEVLIVHDQSITDTIEWIEYDKTEDTFNIILDDGTLIPLGIALDQKMKGNISNGVEVKLAHIQNSQILSSQSVMLLIRDA